MKSTSLKDIGHELSRDGSIHVTNELINTVSHLAAACLALLGAVLLIAQASADGQPWKIVGFSIYGLSLLSLFIFSTLHHGIDHSPKVNQRLRALDYSAVYGLIAGTVTPIVLGVDRNTIGWSVLGVVWTVAIIGITLRLALKHLPAYVSNTLYIVLGWMPIVLIAAGTTFPSAAILLLVVGGIFYSVGFVCYVLQKPNLKPGVFGFHEVWHFFVVIAALLQYLFMYLYILPNK
jgi:hemolysin III